MPPDRPPLELVVRPRLRDSSTRVVLGRGLLRTPQPHAAGLRLLLVTDRNVATAGWSARVEEALGARASGVVRVELEPGERHKTMAAVAGLWEEWSRAGAGRDSVVVAVGGGVVGDVAGFAAATFMRGIPWIGVPTTTLAMADSCLGGKVGVNTSAGKNLAGSVHHPTHVIADLDTLETLDARARVGGWAEVVKAAVIGDAPLLDELRERAADVRAGGEVADLLLRSLRVKAAIVEDDELEHGRREILNFGHTVAHALEHATDHALTHGEAVSLGMAAETRVAAGRGLLPADLAELVADTCSRLGLPRDAPSVPRDRFLEALQADKKTRAGRLRIALPRSLGSHDLRCTVEVRADELADALLG